MSKWFALLALVVEFLLVFLRERRVREQMDGESLARVDRAIDAWNDARPDSVRHDDPELFRAEAGMRDYPADEIPPDVTGVSETKSE